MQDRGPVVLAVTAPMIAAATLFVSLRFVSRAAIVKRVQLDDWFILAAWIIAFGLSFTICYSVQFGLGRHQDTISPESLATLQRLEYTFSVLYNPALMATKTSICVFYLSLADQQPVFKWTTVGTLVVVNGAGLALSLLNIFQCHPISYLFSSPAAESAHCTDIITLYLSSAPVNIITDLVMLLLPMPLLKAMNLPRKQKIILYITFGFGIFVTAVDVVRIAYLQQATLNRLEAVRHMGRHGTNSETGTDFSWYASLSFMWTAIEVNVGIMCACVPALKPLVFRFLPAMIKDSTPTVSNKQRSAISEKSPIASNAKTLPHPDFAIGELYKETTKDSTSGEGEDVVEEEAEEGGEMGFYDFLNMPNTAEFAGADDDTAGMAGLSRKGTNFMTFIDMHEKKSIVFMTNKESIKPIAHVTVLFFLWGFAYGLLNTLNGEFQIVANITPGQSVALHSAYYAGYFLGPISAGRFVLKRWGFKSCYMVGLVIYGTGTLVFWPSAVLTSFAAFFVSNLIVGYGLSILEVAANPFIALCGPPRYAEVRLNLSQAVQACGTVVSPLLAKKALFNNVLDAPSLIDVQWTYLAITLFTFLLAFIYYCVKLPEVSDSDLEEASKLSYPKGKLDAFRSKQIVWITLAFGVFAQFFYVGAQEGVSTSLETYLTDLYPQADPVNFEAIGHSLFAASRFLAAFIGLFIRPRFALMFFFVGAIVFAALAMNFSGLTAGAMVACVYFFEGPLFSYIFALSLHGLGKHTKDGSVLITAAISGGAVIPPIQYAVANGHGTQYSYCVLVAAFAAAALFPVWLNAHPAATALVEPLRGPVVQDAAPSTTVVNDKEVDNTFSWGAKQHKQKAPSDLGSQNGELLDVSGWLK